MGNENIEITKEEVKKIREQFGLTKDQFAQLLEVSVMTVNRWETQGIRSISNSSAGKLEELRKILSTFLPISEADNLCL